MKAKQRREFQWDALEKRMVLSTVQPTLPVTAEVQRIRVPNRSPIRAPRLPVVAGTIRGAFQYDPGLSLDHPAVPHLDVSGTGNVRPLGPVVANGAVVGGTTAGARVQGTVVLANERGTLVLNLNGRVPKNPKATERVQVTVSEGTGDYSTFTGRGSGTIRIGQLSSETLSGTFNVSFSANPPRR